MNAAVTYRDLLRFELQSRSAKNPAYSLRAYAKSLGLDAAHLSRVLRGQKQLSMESGYLVAQRLFPATREREYFLHLLALESTTDGRKREMITLQLARLKARSAHAKQSILELEQFEAISSWYHFAILDLSTIPGFPMDAKNVAGYLGIRVSEAKQAIARLERLGLLASTGGRLSKTREKLSTPNGLPSSALRSYHKQVLGKAIEAIESQSVDRRYFISRTVALKRRQLQELRELVDGFFERVSKEVGNESEPDALYQVNAQFFDLKEGEVT